MHDYVAHTRIAGLPVALASERDLTARMVSDCRRHRRHELPHPTTVLDANGHAVSLYATDESFAAAIEQADIVHADGQFLVILSRFGRGYRVPERTATTDLFHAAARVARDNGLSFYMLGATEEVSRACADHLGRTYPGLQIVGRRNGYFPEAETDAIIAEINAAYPDVLWVGLGKPLEQLFTIRHRNQLKCGWVVTCGGCFNYLTGAYIRAPQWVQQAGFEWLHRMVTGPRYLLKRYAWTVPHALWLSLRWMVLRSLQRLPSGVPSENGKQGWL